MSEKLKSYTGKIPSLRLVKTNEQVINDTVLWAKWIASDNRFHYGYTNKKEGIDAHHNGCFFCGTNTNKGSRSKKGIKKYKRTYCCNPFVGAAWAHGGCVPKALAMCQHGGSWDFHRGHGYDICDLFTKKGHPAIRKLKAGDVLCNDHHVSLYIGKVKGKHMIAEAAGSDDNIEGSKKWNNSIRVCELTKNRYKGFQRVYRYNAFVDTKAAIRHGEISDRTAEWQAFIDWYFKGKLGKPDRYFGDKTLKWTKKFQEDVGITDDGVVGKDTLEKAKKAKITITTKD